MNQRCFRVIFNRPRGQAIVVGELARTPGHVSSAGSVPTRSRWRRCTLPLVLTLTLGWMPGAEATIVADANAPSAQQPSVVTAPNGASPLVNIQTPTAAGISHNTYSRFDVEPAGAILNNSRQAVHTQLAGTIAGNPHLTTGPAQVILNEVNSSNPSLLRGFIEVAGQRAHVVIANPSGIYVKGGGFINTSGVTLTTGTPQLQNGHLDSYRVIGGLIKIDGEGLDTRSADYTQIFAQAVQLNAAVHAKKLRVTTGNNLVKVDNGQATPIASSTEAPEFALDVAKLGGMYAHHIFIVGTENGVGMRNSGLLQANAGSLFLNNQGLLTNNGTIQSDDTLKLEVAGLDNRQGQINSVGSTLKITSSQPINNHQGQLRATKALHCRSLALRNVQGGITAGTRLTVDTQKHAVDNRQGTLSSSGKLQVRSGVLNNHQGLLQAGSTLTVNTHGKTLINSHSATQQGIVGQKISLTTGQLLNRRGVISGQNARIESSRLSGQGKLKATGDLQLSLTSEQPQDLTGVLQANGQLTLTANGELNNYGRLEAGTQLIAQAPILRNQATGIIQSPQTLVRGGDIPDGEVHNRGLIDGKSVEVRATTINNLGGGQLNGDQLAIGASHTLNNQAATIAARQRLVIGTQHLHNDDHAQIASQGSAVIGKQLLDQQQVTGQALTLTNQSSTIEIQDEADFTIATINNDAESAIHAEKQLTIHSGSINGEGPITSGSDLQVTLTSDQPKKLDGQLKAKNNLVLTANGELNNYGRLEAGEQLTAQAYIFRNYGPGIIQAQQTLVRGGDTQDGEVRNRGLIDGEHVEIRANFVNNFGGSRLYGDNITIGAHTTLNNHTEHWNGIATIAARQRLVIGAKYIHNYKNALIFSGSPAIIGEKLGDVSY